MQYHNPSSPVSASSPTLIATPIPGSKTISFLRERCAPLSLGSIEPMGKGFIQPHHSNIPRRHVRRVAAPPKVVSEAEKLKVRRRRWAHTACLQEIGSSSGIFVAFSPEQQQAAGSSMECTKSGRLSPLFTSSAAEPPSSSNEEEYPTSSGTTPSLSSGSSQPSPPPSAPLQPATAAAIDPSLLAEFAAIIRIRIHPGPGPGPCTPSPSPPGLIHDITVPPETTDDGTPHFTEAQFTAAHAFLRAHAHANAAPPSSSPPSDRPHPRHGTHVPAPPPPPPKILILAPRTHAADALALAAGWGCLSGLRLPPLEADEEADVDILSEDRDAVPGPVHEGLGGAEAEAPFGGEEDRETPVHALLMRLHDLDPGLKDEWRGVLSRSGMDALGAWVARC